MSARLLGCAAFFEGILYFDLRENVNRAVLQAAVLKDRFLGRCGATPVSLGSAKR